MGISSVNGFSVHETGSGVLLRPTEAASTIMVDEVETSNSIDLGTITRVEKLMALLKTSGALIAKGTLGPSFYTAKPIVLGKVLEHDVHGWRQGNVHQAGEPMHVVILGAEKDAKIDRVYYSCCSKGGIESKLYCNSFTAFRERTACLYSQSDEWVMVGDLDLEI